MNKEKVIRNFALANAVKYEGSAKPGNIVGGIIQAYPDWKSDIKSLMPIISSVVAEVNKMTVMEQMEELKQNAPELLEKKRDDRPKDALKPLKNVTYGKVIMRMEPSPSGALHVGHAFPTLLNSEYCREYDGKFILRISDTNPDNIDNDAYKLLIEGTKWLTEDNVFSVEIQSDRMELYYSHLLTMVEEGHAYVCSCTSEDFRSTITKQLACPCRQHSNEQHAKRWGEMLTSAPEGSYVVRMKSDVRHKNPALRDFPLARINENSHPRVGTKYRVWPLMNLAVAIDDHHMGLTHVLRGKDHYDNTRRQMYIYEAFKWTPPEFIHTGRVNFNGLKLSASAAQQGIKNGEYTGWDDIRLPFMPAFKRRGYKPAAFVKFVKSMGVTMVDKSVEAGEFFKTLNFYNKELIDATTNRYFFVENPVEISIKGCDTKNIEVDLHPEHIEGGRDFSCGSSYYVDPVDVARFGEGKPIRLMHNLNFVKTGNEYNFSKGDHVQWKEGGGSVIIHWLPVEHSTVDIRLVMDDGSLRTGLGESGLGNLKVGETVQFERVCFCTYQGLVDGMHEFWYLHK